ncbi:acyltransferase [Paraburkholderia sp.]|uniref:acyltransferase family protein n=1 Tax=Paraburkholderia sp. TaxID=1926495 RepID=UPI0023895B4A|nr:acyltransferase [Paraburkholderia sp.]MDE1180165.1 acyltransferase [Paraburkholderia sp.]
MKSDTTIKSFEGLRGVAALLVAVYHFNGFLRPGSIVDSFYLLVDLFFILSGFVIFRAYQDGLSTPRQLGRFMVRRFGRLYPLHAFAALFFVAVTCSSRMLKVVMTHLGLGAALSAPGSHAFDLPGVPEILSNLFLLQGIGPFSHYEINGPSWSISTEFYTYIVLALGVYFLKGRVRMIAFSVIAAVGLALAFYGSVHADACLQTGHCLDSHLEYAFPRCLGGFFLGAIADRLAPRVALAGERALSLAQVGAAALALFIMWKSISIPSYAFFGVFAFFIVVLTLASDIGPLAMLLKTRVCQFLGKISYSMYLVHAPLVFIGHLTMKPLPLVVKFAVLAGYLALVIAISTQTFRFIEAPGRDFARKLSNRWFGGDIPQARRADDELQGVARP